MCRSDIGNIHGDETVGRENLIRCTLSLSCKKGLITYNIVIHLLCTQYRVDERITRLIDSTDLYILPSMNPDGYELGQRYNDPVAPTAPVDLNRDFPDQFDATGTVYNFQPETKAVMDFCNAHYFVASISFHGGDVVVNYPWDGNKEARNYNKHLDFNRLLPAAPQRCLLSRA